MDLYWALSCLLISYLDTLLLFFSDIKHLLCNTLVNVIQDKVSPKSISCLPHLSQWSIKYFCTQFWSKILRGNSLWVTLIVEHYKEVPSNTHAHVPRSCLQTPHVTWLESSLLMPPDFSGFLPGFSAFARIL